MRHFLILFLFFYVFLTNSSLAQEKIWLDSNLEKTTQEKAHFYKFDKKLAGEIVFYYKSKAVYRKVFYDEGKLNGNFYEFYENGDLRETGSYVNNFRDGMWKEYYKGGKIKGKGKYDKGEKVGIWKVFYKNEK